MVLLLAVILLLAVTFLTQIHGTPTSSHFTISCDIFNREIHHTAVILPSAVTFLIQRFMVLLPAVFYYQL